MGNRLIKQQALGTYHNAQQEHTTTRNAHIPQRATVTYPKSQRAQTLNEQWAHTTTRIGNIPIRATGKCSNGQPAHTTVGIGHTAQRATGTYPNAQRAHATTRNRLSVPHVRYKHRSDTIFRLT